MVSFPVPFPHPYTQVSDSPTAVEAIVNAIPVNMTYPYSVYGRTNNYGFDFDAKIINNS